MFETRITVLGNKGIYPKETVLCDEVGFSRYKGIPLWLNVMDKDNRERYRYSSKPTTLKAAFLFSRRDFPAYNFPPNFDKCSLYISSDTKPVLRDILKRVKLILKGVVKPPVLYCPIESGDSYEERMSKIMSIRSKPEYIDLFHCKRKQFIELLSEWRGGYSFSEHKCTPQAVKKYYNLFVNSSRLIHIALYYYNNAASLTRENYIEDAGINLHLALEAIIRDYMDFHSIKNKRKAIESFISKVWPPDWGTDYLDDLWKSRNQFLAHIDADMFTEDQNIHDPDEYCYDTFESISFLVTRYIRYKNRLIT
jgi:hypothetical protein